MKIIGNGMIANAFINNCRSFDFPLYVFASGVSNSLCEEENEFNREIDLLKNTLLECLRHDGTIVYFSSAGALYSSSNEPSKETDFPCPKTLYGKHKLFCEDLIRDSNVNYLIARLPNVVGKTKNTKQLIPFLVHSARAGFVKLLENARRDIIDIDDVSRIIFALLDCSQRNLTLNIASGNSILVLDIFKEIQSILRLHPKVEIIKAGDVHLFDVSLMKSLLPGNFFFEKNYYKKVIKKYLPYF